jgi:hypothetical protein
MTMKKPEQWFRLFLMGGKIWRRPTLAEAIQPLPSAMLRLTAEFGMGSGRTTALWPPKKLLKNGLFSENYTQIRNMVLFIREFEIAVPLLKGKKRSSRTTD